METKESDSPASLGNCRGGPQLDEVRENRPHDEATQDDDETCERCDDCGSLSDASQHDHDGSDAVSELGCSYGNSESQSTAMCITNIMTMPSAPTYADGEYEDDKAKMIANLMKDHSNIVSSSLVERSILISSVTWLSHHVPGCVLKSLFEPIMRARKRTSINSRLYRGKCSDGDHVTNQSYDGFAVAKNHVKTDCKTQSPFLNTLSSPKSSISPERPYGVPPIPPFLIEDSLPFTTGHDGALLFVDISGFTKISQIMDVEHLSNAINSYFQMIVNKIISHGGDIIKFAGDALFAEWKVSHHESHHDLDCCVSIAATCAANIVASCSNYIVCKPLDITLSTRHLPRQNSSLRNPLTSESTGGETSEHDSVLRRASAGDRWRRSFASASKVIATLNVKCAIGVGRIVGIHVGDNVTRREYFILGDTIGQVARAESAAGMGQVFASPETVQHLSRLGDLRGDWKEAVKDGQPIRIADHDEQFFQIKRRSQKISTPRDDEKMLVVCEDLNSTELLWLKKMLSLYVHPVVVNDDNERAPTSLKLVSNQERHITEAELRTVYTCFISPLVDYKLTGDEVIDQKLFNLLNDIMILTTRELTRVQGHLRQFILDDKGLVLICTFGLRGSTFPDMVAQRALPFSLSIHRALEEDLGIKSTMGATLGKVYCGVVGGLDRHEFAVLGPSVNLAARLMASDKNPGILVDKTVRLLTNKVFFKPLPAIEAKGYNEPVPIFEPMKQASSRPEPEGHWRQAKRNFFGRAGELKQIMRTAKEVTLHDSISKLLLVTAMSGSGKSTLMVQATELVRAMAKKMHRRMIITRNISNEGDLMLPFSLFRSIFKDVLSQVRQEDEESQSSSRKSLSELASTDFSVDGLVDTLSLNTESSTSSRGSTEMTRFTFICRELNAPPEFMEVVGKRFLGIRDGNKNDSATQSESPTLQIQSIVNFMADAFIRCTKHVNLVLLALDDVQWMDELSWKVVQTIFERAENVLTLCGSRPPSSNLPLEPIFFSDLQGQYQKEGRYLEISLAPFEDSEVKEMIADTLNIKLDEVDTSFIHNVFTTSGGMPHYISYILDAIKRNNLTVRLENGMIGMKNSAEKDDKIFGSVDELLLHRIDALDSSVRTVLHLSAVLGTEFNLVDAALAYEELFGVDESKQLEAAISLRESFDVASKEGILEKSLFFLVEDGDDEMMHEEENICPSMINVRISLKGRRQTHPFYSDNCRLRFTHDSWKTSILNVMLVERKQELHKYVAISLERDLDGEAHNQDDFEKQITVFKHWKSSGSFTKASASALNIGGQLMLLGLNSQAILLFDDVLDTLKGISYDEVGRSRCGGVSTSVLEAIDVPELDNLIKVNIAKGKAYLTLGQGVAAADAYQSALDILHNSPCADDDDFDRSVSFPIFSGLFAVLKMGGIKDDAECSYEQDMCKRFVEQARLNGDPVHYGRALSMEAETFGRLGNFEQALEVVERIKPIYIIETQHTAICKAYGSDRVAQAFSHSVNFCNALGRTQAALETCNYIVEQIIPKSDPKNVHNSFCLLYSVIVTLKDNGLSQRAQEVFQERIVDPFEVYFGPGGSTFSKPLFKPILVMLELHAEVDLDAMKIEEYTAWALDEDNFEKKVAALENAWAAFSASPIALHSEICFSLGKRHNDTERRHRLIQKAIILMEKSDANTASFVYSNSYAKTKLEVMKSFARGEAQQEMHSSGEIYSALTSQEWSNLGHAESVLVAATEDRTKMNFRAAALLEYHLDRLVKNRDPDAEVSETTKIQLNKFVAAVSQSYNDAEFHSYSHALHVTTSMNALLSYALIEDPLNIFSLVFSALLHDAGHTGMSNKILCETSHSLSMKFPKVIPISERNSIDICLSLLFRPEYETLRDSIAPGEIDKIQFAKTLFQCILVTDIATPKSVELAICRFEVCEGVSHLPAADLCPLKHYMFDLLDGIGLDEDVKVRHPNEFTVTPDELQVCMRNEHLMMLSDIAHLLQGWENFVKWNFRLYKEIHECFKKGLCADPREGWYQGQIVFTDNYVIPLSKRSRRFLQGGFSDKLLHNGLTNQKIWMEHGKLATEIISNAVEEDEEEFDVLQRLFELSAL